MTKGYRLRSGSARRVFASISAAALLTSLMVVPALAEHRENVDIIDADSAIEAALNWSDFTFDASNAVIIGRDDVFADNLASGLIQGLGDGSPLLLTETEGLVTTVADEIERLGATVAHILGGDEAISQAVEDELVDMGLSIHRHAGETRVETAIDIASKHATNATSAILARSTATGTDPSQAFADSLAAGAWSAESGMPVLLTQSNELNDNLATYLDGADITKIFIVGGTSAVSAAVAAELEASGIATERVSGATRFETAVAIAAERGFDSAADADTVILTEGQQANAWAGGFAAAAYSALTGAPIVLSNGADLPAPTEEFLTDGTAALVCGPFVEAAACDAAADLLGLGEVAHVPATVTSRPELQSASIIKTVTSTQVTPTQAAGTYVQYTFDEPVAVIGAVPTNFTVYNRTNQPTDGFSIQGFSNDNRTVEVRFDTITTSTAADELTLATVVLGAVRDLQGLLNPEGDAPIGTASSTPITAGTTSAPDLLSVGGFRQASSAVTTAVDFVFDQAAFVSGTTGFNLVLVDNTLLPCTADPSTTVAGGGTVAGGSGTTTVTVTCTHAGSVNGQTTPLTASQVARGTVNQFSVYTNAAFTMNPNPLQAATVLPAPSTTGPDLVGAAFEAAVAVTTGTTAAQGLTTGTYDRVTYRFDQAVAAPDANDFRVYLSTGAEVMPASPGTQTPVLSQDGTQVSILYPEGTVGTAVGASVRDTAVTNGLRDEVAVSSSQAQTRTPGETTGPQLTGVAVDRGTDAFGQQTGWRATYTFDSNVTVSSQTSFFVYAANGARYVSENSSCAPVTATGQTTSNQVRCTDFGPSNVDITASGPTTDQPEVGASVLGTVAAGAVSSGGQFNPEGAEVISGSTGTPTA